MVTTDETTFEINDYMIFSDCDPVYSEPELVDVVWRSPKIKVTSSYMNPNSFSVETRKIIVDDNRVEKIIPEIVTNKIIVNQVVEQNIVGRILVNSDESEIAFNLNNNHYFDSYKLQSNFSIPSKSIYLNIIDTRKDRVLPNNNIKIANATFCDDVVTIVTPNISGFTNIPVISNVKRELHQEIISTSVDCVITSTDTKIKSDIYQKFNYDNLKSTNLIGSSSTIGIIKVSDNDSYKNKWVETTKIILQ